MSWRRDVVASNLFSLSLVVSILFAAGDGVEHDDKKVNVLVDDGNLIR